MMKWLKYMYNGMYYSGQRSNSMCKLFITLSIFSLVYSIIDITKKSSYFSSQHIQRCPVQESALHLYRGAKVSCSHNINAFYLICLMNTLIKHHLMLLFSQWWRSTTYESQLSYFIVLFVTRITAFWIYFDWGVKAVAHYILAHHKRKNRSKLRGVRVQGYHRVTNKFPKIWLIVFRMGRFGKKV